MINFEVLVLCVCHEFFKFFAEQVNFSKIQRAKVGEERFVNEIIIDAKVKGMLTGFRWTFIADPVKASGDDLNRLVFCCKRCRVALACSFSDCLCRSAFH